MSRTYIEVIYIDPNVCFECGAPATERHHVIPHFLGGTKTVPLCGMCHAKVHGVDGAKRAKISELTKAALAAKRERGETWNRNTNIDAAVIAATKARIDKHREWMKVHPAVQLAKERCEQGVSRNEILKELGELWEKDPKKWGTREGCKVSKGVLSKWFSYEQPKQ